MPEPISGLKLDELAKESTSVVTEDKETLKMLEGEEDIKGGRRASQQPQRREFTRNKIATPHLAQPLS